MPASSGRTNAAKRYKRVENATAMIWKLLTIAPKTWRTLKGFPLLRDVYDGKHTSMEKSQRKFKGKRAGHVMAQNTEPAWQFQHSVDCNTPRQFAWDYWTNIANWNDPPARFHLDGPFDVGSQLTTSLPGQTLRSVIRDVIADREAIIEMQLPDAILSFHWKFENLSEHRTRITQWLVLSGPEAKSLVPRASTLEESAPEGMKKLVAAIERAQQLKREV